MTGGVQDGAGTSGLTYAAAGVDVEAGDRAVQLMKAAVLGTHGPEVLGGIGGFAGLFDASALTAYRHPVLASSTDGVGTKVAIAQALDRHDTVGFDLVGMVVDDLVVCGARPLLMTDYIACGKVVPERIATLVAGIAAGCRQARCALVGGETAEHPGLLGPDEYDLAGAAVGVVEADAVLGPDRVRPGDVVLALASSGLHSNGFSLVRRVLEVSGWALDRDVPEFGRSLGEELLEPTTVYAGILLDLIAALNPGSQPGSGGAEPGSRATEPSAGARSGGVHAISHVTGGGLAANLARVLPRGVEAVLDRGSWTPPAVFEVIARLGGVPQADLERTLNLGVGMVLVLDPGSVDAASAHLAAAGMRSWVLGEVHAEGAGAADGTGADQGQVTQGAKGVDGGRVRLIGEHPR